MPATGCVPVVPVCEPRGGTCVLTAGAAGPQRAFIASALISPLRPPVTILNLYRARPNYSSRRTQPICASCVLPAPQFMCASRYWRLNRFDLLLLNAGADLRCNLDAAVYVTFVRDATRPDVLPCTCVLLLLLSSFYGRLRPFVFAGPRRPPRGDDASLHAVMSLLTKVEVRRLARQLGHIAPARSHGALKRCGKCACWSRLASEGSED